jgi:flagellar biosynthetic protein FliQ
MTPIDAIELVQSAILAIVVVAGPSIVAAMLVGIVIALLQALTQVQEVTLTFVPKILAILVVTMLTAPFAGTVLYAFTERLYQRIEVGFDTTTSQRN